MITQEQRAIIDSDEQHMLVVASAGSGKSFTIIEKVSHLIKNKNVKPESILLTSFSRTANSELYEKVKDKLGELIAKQITIGTIHSICYKIMMENLSFFGVSKIDIVNESYLSAILFNDRTTAFDSKKEAVKCVYKYMRERSSGIEDKELNYQDKMACRDAHEVMHAKGKYLYDDLMFNVLHLFEKKPDLKKTWQDKFDYIILDEGQDTSLIQWKIIEELMTFETHTVIVGDVKQNIYGFRGAHHIFMDDFRNRYQSKVFPLSETFRFGEPMAEISNKLVETMIHIDPVYRIKTKTNVKCQNKPEFIIKGEYAQIDFIIDDIKSKILQGYEYKDLNLVYRYNKESQEYVKRFLAENIPFEVKSGDVFMRVELQFVIKAMSLFNHFEISNCIEVMSEYNNFIGDKTLTNIYKEISPVSSIDDFADRALKVKIEGVGPKKYQSLKDFKRAVDQTRDYLNSCKDEKIHLIRFADMMNIQDTKFMKDVENAEGVVESEERLEFLAFFNESFSNSTFKSVTDWYNDCTLNNVTIKDKEKNAVQFKTIHGCKGQTLPVVYLLLNRVGDARFIEEENLPEESFCLYVALTRAEEYLYCMLNKPDSFRFPCILTEEVKNAFIKTESQLQEEQDNTIELLQSNYDLKPSNYNYHFKENYRITKNTGKAILVSDGSNSHWIPISAASVNDGRIYVLDWIIRKNNLQKFCTITK